MAKYELPDGGLEVLLLALQVFEKYGSKYPSIVMKHHYVIAEKIQRELLLIGANGGKTEDNRTKIA